MHKKVKKRKKKKAEKEEEGDDACTRVWTTPLSGVLAFKHIKIIVIKNSINICMLSVVPPQLKIINFSAGERFLSKNKE